MGPVSTGIQALMLLHQVSESRHSVSDRYYNALYSKLMDPALKHSNRQVHVELNVMSHFPSPKEGFNDSAVLVGTRSKEKTN